jgi:hypothetical protein
METTKLDTPKTSKKMPTEHAHIKGWGIDADSENEPTYPMKKYTGDDHRRLNYDRPSQQQTDVEILQSNERPTATAVFGTSTPPSGLSGMLRRFAFRFSEGNWGHWLTLILADRVNMVEGIVDDVKKGYVPNIMAERGWNAELKYNRAGLVQKALIAAAITGGILAILNYKNRRDGLIR